MLNSVNDALDWSQRSLTFAREMAQQAYAYLPELPELPMLPTITSITDWLSSPGLCLNTATTELCFTVPTHETVDVIAHTDARYFSNQVRAVSTSPTPQDNKELEQFLKDLPRFTAVMCNGAKCHRDEYENLLEVWANTISSKTDLEIQMIKNVICRLNQTFGNVSLEYISQFSDRSAINGTTVDFFRTLQQSEQCTQILSLEDLKVSLEFKLPLQAFSMDSDANRSANDLTADLIFTTVFTCNFALKPDAKDFLTHTMTFTKGDTAFHLQFPRNIQLRTRTPQSL